MLLAFAWNSTSSRRKASKRFKLSSVVSCKIPSHCDHTHLFDMSEHSKKKKLFFLCFVLTQTTVSWIQLLAFWLNQYVKYRLPLAFLRFANEVIITGRWFLIFFYFALCIAVKRQKSDLSQSKTTPCHFYVDTFEKEFHWTQTDVQNATFLSFAVAFFSFRLR